MAKRKYKKRKIDKQSMIIVIIISLVVMVFVIISTINRLKPKEKEEEKPAELISPEIQTDYDIFDKYNSVLEDKRYEDNNFIVEVDFEKDLYDENDRSNRDYFESLIEELIVQYDTDFYLIDKNKQIEIEVYKDEMGEYKYKINNIENYFENSTVDQEIRKYQEIGTIKNSIKSEDINSFSYNGWEIGRVGAKVDRRDKEYLYYKNYRIRTDNTTVDKMFFEKNYEEEIIEGVKVGEDFKEIEKKLGEPTFKGNNFIAYKTDTAYVFFYENESVVYPNIKYNNNKLEEIITKLFNEEYNERKFFAFDILQNCKDFKSKLIENNNLKIWSVNRGIEIIVDESHNAQITIYNNYDMTDLTKQYIREKSFITNFEEDLIFKTENESIE